MNWQKDAEYKLKLALGFYEEGKQNLKYKQYRSCVDNSQLSIENSAKAIIVCFTPLGKTHSPVQGLRKLLQEERITDWIRKGIQEIIPIVEEHGFEEHILSDYGDEESYRTPWEIFDKKSAEDIYGAATRVLTKAKEIISLIYELRGLKRKSN